jgi:hypothetical protein
MISSHFVVFLPLTAVFTGLFGISAFFLGKGIGKRTLLSRMGKYNAAFGASTVMPIERLSAVTGQSPGTIKKDIKKAAKIGLHFTLYLDDAKTTVIKGEAAYREYLSAKKHMAQQQREQAERERRMADPATASIETFKAEGYDSLAKIRAANIALPGEEISAKLEKLERTVMNIVNYVDAYPEKLGETRKLMAYHLPTTLKLVEKYCEYEQLQIVPENVASAKKDIESTLDIVNEAFSNLYNDLFSEDTLDISTDIDVLNQMLEKEGLTGIKFDVSDFSESKEPELVFVKTDTKEKTNE